jgi:hypothetical protein
LLPGRKTDGLVVASTVEKWVAEVFHIRDADSGNSLRLQRVYLHGLSSQSADAVC